MSQAGPPGPGSRPRSPSWERLTALVLLAVLVVLGWILTVAHQPGWLRLASLEAEVVVVLLLLTAALVLVSVVALLHTGSGTG